MATTKYQRRKVEVTPSNEWDGVQIGGLGYRRRCGAATDSGPGDDVASNEAADKDYQFQLRHFAERPRGTIEPPNRRGYNKKGDTGGVIQP